MYFKKTVMFFVFRIIIMSKMFYPTVCCNCCNLVQFAIFWLAWMYDWHECMMSVLGTTKHSLCTWQQSCIVLLLLLMRIITWKNIWPYSIPIAWGTQTVMKQLEARKKQKALNIYWAETSERTCLSYCVKITDFHVWKVLNPATAIVSSGPNEIVSKKMIQTAIRDW